MPTPVPAARRRGWLARPLEAVRSTSLAQRFLLANLLILLVAGLTVGVWVGDQLEHSIVDRTASVTGLYVESIIEPSVASLADGGTLTADEIATLDSHLANPPLADRVRSLRLWSEDGQVVYSPNGELIGQAFPVEGNLARAWQGEVMASMDDLSGDENAWERARWDRLLEMYIPVRERGSDRIIAVAEFYLPPGEIDQQVAEARRMTWLLVTLAIVLSAVLLFGIVKRGSDTIRRQEMALGRQVDELTGLLEENATLSERVNSAAQRTTTLNERTMRRVSSDLHDGPGQMLSLAILRLDGLRTRAAAGRPARRGRAGRGRGRPARGHDRHAWRGGRPADAGAGAPGRGGRGDSRHPGPRAPQRHAGHPRRGCSSDRLPARQDRALPGAPGGSLERHPPWRQLGHPRVTGRPLSRPRDGSRLRPCEPGPRPGAHRAATTARASTRRRWRRRGASGWPASGSRPRSWVVRSPSAPRHGRARELRVWWPVQGQEEEA